MPLAGWCDVDNTWVWVNEDGSCVNGHGPEHVSRVYDTDTQNAPPPAPVPETFPTAPPVAPGYSGPGYGAPYGGTQPQPARSNKATLSLVFGIASILCCFPIITIPAGIAGIIFGVQGLNTDRRTLAIVGIVLSVIGVIASIANALLGAYFALSDPQFLDQFMDIPGR